MYKFKVNVSYTLLIGTEVEVEIAEDNIIEALQKAAENAPHPFHIEDLKNFEVIDFERCELTKADAHCIDSME